MSLVGDKYRQYKLQIWVVGALLVGAFILGPILGVGGCPEASVLLGGAGAG